MMVPRDKAFEENLFWRFQACDEKIALELQGEASFGSGPSCIVCWRHHRLKLDSIVK